MKPKVYLAYHVPPEAEQYLDKYCEYRKWDEKGIIPRDILLKEIADVDGLLVLGHKINEELLAHAPRLKIVSNVTVGYNNFDLPAMKARGVIGTNTAGVLNDSVADLVLGLMVAVARRIPELDRLVKSGGWVKGMDTELFGQDVYGCTLGIIGMGNIGETIAKRAVYGFDMQVIYHNRRRKPEAEDRLGVKYRSLEALLEEADFIVLMTPLTPETRGMIGYKQFCMMKKTAIFINASRGGAVDEAGLIRALEEKRIFGAGLDVFAKEPVSPDSPLLQLPNVVAVPHIGGATAKARSAMAMRAVYNLVKGVLGENPPNLIEEFKET